MIRISNYRQRDTWIVYIHTTPNDKKYVGITSRSVNERWKNGNGYKKNEYFYRAICKYGWNNIKHEIIHENLTFKEAAEIEKNLIRKYKSNNYKYGYNESSGGEGKCGVPTSELQKKVTSERLKREWKEGKYNGMKHTQEWKKNHSKKMKENWNDPEFRRLHSGIYSPCYGKKRESMYKSNNPHAKKVVCLNTKTIYNSIIEASEDTNAYRFSIGECCIGRIKSTGTLNGVRLAWRYYKDYILMSDDEITDAIKEANTIRRYR